MVLPCLMGAVVQMSVPIFLYRLLGCTLVNYSFVWGAQPIKEREYEAAFTRQNILGFGSIFGGKNQNFLCA